MQTNFHVKQMIMNILKIEQLRLQNISKTIKDHSQNKTIDINLLVK